MLLLSKTHHELPSTTMNNFTPIQYIFPMLFIFATSCPLKQNKSRTVGVGSIICHHHIRRNLYCDRFIAFSKESSPHSTCSINFQHLLFSFRSSSSCLCLLPRLPVTSILVPIFPSSKCFRKHFLCKLWPILLTFFIFIVRKTLPSSTFSILLHF